MQFSRVDWDEFEVVETIDFLEEQGEEEDNFMAEEHDWEK